MVESPKKKKKYCVVSKRDALRFLEWSGTKKRESLFRKDDSLLFPFEAGKKREGKVSNQSP